LIADAYKFLRAGAVAPFSGFEWPQPAGDVPGEWVETAAPAELCRSGVHACRESQLPRWLDEELWRIELDGDVIEEHDSLVASRGRLLSRVERWDAEAARAFAEACAWRAREHAAVELYLARLWAEAAALEQAATLAAVVEAASEGHLAATASRARRAASVVYAAMTTAEHAAARPGVYAYMSWVAFAGYGAAVTAGHRAPGGDLVERQLQAVWLADRLALDA
jgi:hypothetical protein